MKHGERHGRWIAVTGIALLLAGAALVWNWPAPATGTSADTPTRDSAGATHTPAANRTAARTSSSSLAAHANYLPPHDRAQPGTQSPGTQSAYEPAAVVPDAAQSLAMALQHGDDRSPPIEHDETLRDAPTPAELADPAAYRRYENRRREKLYRSYDQEAVIALNDMQRDLQRARDEQLPPELIQEGEEKAAKLAETLRALRAGELGESASPQQ